LVMHKPDFRPRIFSTDRYQITLPEGHKFPVSKYGILRDLIEKEGLFQLEQAAPADADIVALAHEPAYVAGFMEGSLPASAIRRIGLPWSQVLVKRAFASVGGTISASLQAPGTWLGRDSGRRNTSRVSIRRRRLLRIQ
jgi:acetoin utilization deacetylase AcuC-like enzyme